MVYWPLEQWWVWALAGNRKKLGEPQHGPSALEYHSLLTLSDEAGTWSSVSLVLKSMLCLLQSQECEVIWQETGTKNGWKTLRLLYPRLNHNLRLLNISFLNLRRKIMTWAGHQRALWTRLLVAEAKATFSFPPDSAFQIRPGLPFCYTLGSHHKGR